MAKSVYDIVRSMPRNFFRKLRKNLNESEDFYLLTEDPKFVPEAEKVRARAIFIKFGIPERMIGTNDGLEHAAWAVQARSTTVK